MKPGRELDALVAEKVMGWKMSPASFGPSRDVYQCWNIDGDALMTIHMTPRFSEDIAAAWEVANKLQGHKAIFWREWVVVEDLSEDRHANHRFQDKFFVKFQRGPFKENTVESDSMESISHAICLAALKAVGYETD